MSDPVIVWFRRELRVADHPALHAAIERAERVVPVFVLDRAMLSVSPRRSAYLLSALGSLRAELRRRGADLVVRRGDAASTLRGLARATGATAVHATEDATPRAHARLASVRAALDIPVELYPGTAAHALGEISTGDGRAYRVFGPFHRRWLAAPVRVPLPAPRRIRAVRARSDPLPRARTRFDADRFPASEDAARARLGQMAAARAYDDDRHRLDGDGGARLSPAFRFGVLSAASAVEVMGDAGQDAWLRQLAWRDFALHAVAAEPSLLTRSPTSPGWRWRSPDGVLDDWRRGRTGAAGVDAAMRQLAREGWISNRARMLVASYLSRDERVHWREGARHFMRELLDGDPSVNAINWQWVAGTGHDRPAPFWRLAPDRQVERHDADGAWRARWLT